MYKQIELMNAEEVLLYSCPFACCDTSYNELPPGENYCCPEVSRVDGSELEYEMTITHMRECNVDATSLTTQFRRWSCRCQLTLFTAAAIICFVTDIKTRGDVYNPPSMIRTVKVEEAEKILEYTKFILEVTISDEYV